MCHCAVVNDACVKDAVDCGAKSLGQVCRATGAGRDCGSCVFALKRLICEHEQAKHTTLLEVEGAAS
ncbi:(2Fe-2S)-binding protein [Intrasporangium sp.]|uniref:(2Fe-2S)-binding protein n=1 Tax=Intrasporangium sp. TaxID=1925024 RepID=UPI0032214F3B